MERLGDPAALSGLDENDPQSMTRWMKSMAGEMGEDFNADMMEEMEPQTDVASEIQDDDSLP